MLYSSALNDLREALDLEKQTINKIRNGMSIAGMVSISKVGRSNPNMIYDFFVSLRPKSIC